MSTNRDQRSLSPRALEERILFDAVCEFCIPRSPETDQPVAVEYAQSDIVQQSAPRELIILDGNLQAIDLLLDSFMSENTGQEYEVQFLDANENGIEQITEILSNTKEQFDAIHILSHGDDGQLKLGDSWLSIDSVNSQSESIALWGDALSEHGDLLFYGCELAANDEGIQLLRSIESLTGADVAASNDLTGAAEKQGDWELEFRSGTIESSVLVSNSYRNVLGPGEIGGTVVDVTEGTGVGVPNVTVSAYDDDNNLVGSAISASDGEYLISGLQDGQQYRVVFTDIPTGYESGAVDSTNDSSVVFATAGGQDIDFTVHLPSEYCESNPHVATTCYIQGTYDGLASNEAAIVTVEHDFTSGSSINVLATIGEVGSTFGLAHQSDSETIFAASFLKRNSGFGPGGMDAIYLIDSENGGYVNNRDSDVPISINLADFGIDVGTELNATARGLSDDPNELVLDQWGWDNQFRLGIGDIDISDDGNTLYVMNLNDHDGDGINGQLVILDISDIENISLKGTVDVTNLVSGVADSDIRPFALNYHEGNVYIGVTGTAESTQVRSDLKAAVYQLNASETAFTLIPIDSTHVYGDGLDAGPTDHIALDYDRPNAYELGSDIQSADFQPWTNDASLYDDSAFLSRPQPLLTDIEFDENGSMILAIANRDAYQLGDFDIYPGSGTENRAGLIAGEILMVANTGSGFELEGDVAAPSNASGGRNLGPGGGEYFFRDNFNSLHDETIMGALAVMPGSGEVVVTMVDPLTVHSGGLSRLSTVTGGNRVDIELYNLGLNGSAAKGAGLGDLEIICRAAPIEIGNYIWNDIDGDGIQDAGENSLANVLVGLFDVDGNLISTVETNANGQYIFSSADGVDVNGDGDSLAEFAYGLDICSYGCEYVVGVLDSNFGDGGALEGMTRTTSNVLGTSNDQTDHSDSDAIAIDVGTGSSRATSGLLISTAGAGANNHTFDFGFTPEPIVEPPDVVGPVTPTQPPADPQIVVLPTFPPICCEPPAAIYSGSLIPETLSLKSDYPSQGGYDVFESEAIDCCCCCEEPEMFFQESTDYCDTLEPQGSEEVWMEEVIDELPQPVESQPAEANSDVPGQPAFEETIDGSLVEPEVPQAAEQDESFKDLSLQGDNSADADSNVESTTEPSGKVLQHFPSDSKSSSDSNKLSGQGLTTRDELFFTQLVGFRKSA